MARRRSSRRGGRGYRARRVNSREPVQRFLIVCEGEQTEPNYFNSFRVPKLVIHVKGYGLSPDALVKMAERERQADDYDQVWCVFDRDQCPAGVFNAAITRAKNRDIQVAYSNESFEILYFLHFHYYYTAVSRNQYAAKLGGLLGHPYRKNSTTIFEELHTRQAGAIRNAERLLAQYSSPNPAADNPSTTVHKLVEQLNRFAR
jgi:hypothetical protein